MNKLLLAVAFVVSTGVAKSEELNPNIVSTTAIAKIGKTVEVTPQKEPIFRNVICNFSVTPGQSSPPSVILTGKVVGNNSGGSREFVPIFFGSTLHPPRLAALTNAAGDFRFRVWLCEKPDEEIIRRIQAANFSDSTNWLQAASVNTAVLYLGGQFNEKAAMLSSYTHVHSLGEFLAKTAKQKK